jgi:peptidoglycan/LPS O-acetylase OafA/YrhL
LFCLGTAAYVFRERITVRWYWLVACIAVYLLTQNTAVGTLLRTVAVGYSVLYLGLRTADWIRPSGKWDDYSYSMYIYGYPCMMALLELARPRNDLVLAMGSILISAPFAIFSWRFVERPALEMFRKHFRGKLIAPGEHRSPPPSSSPEPGPLDPAPVVVAHPLPPNP